MTPAGVFLFARTNRPSILGWHSVECVLSSLAMLTELTSEDIEALLQDLASRAGTASQIASWYSMTADELRAFVDKHRAQLEAMRTKAEAPEPALPAEPTPVELDAMWITNKAARIARMQQAAELLYRDIKAEKFEGAELATAYREFRSYLAHVANELGQLLHRGSGDAGTGDSLAIEIDGIDLDSMR
jgi:hypothetical protein